MVTRVRTFAFFGGLRLSGLTLLLGRGSYAVAMTHAPLDELDLMTRPFEVMVQATVPESDRFRTQTLTTSPSPRPCRGRSAGGAVARSGRGRSSLEQAHRE